MLTFVSVYSQACVANDAQEGRMLPSAHPESEMCMREIGCEAGGILAHQISLHALSPSNQDKMSEHKSMVGEAVTLEG